MAKSGEIDYLKNLLRIHGHLGISHAVGKPFTDPHCANYLAEMGAIRALLPAPPARLLDLGCGTGWTSIMFARCGYEVTGVDIAPDMIRLAGERRDREGLSDLQFLTADYEELNATGTFDAVVFFDALHHAVDETAALACAYRALKVGGLCIASEPGGRHGGSAVAVEAASRFNVTEKSMPPGKIVGLGRRLGFRDFQVYPHAFRIQREVFRPMEFGPPTGTLGCVARLLGRLALAPWRMLARSVRLAVWNEIGCWGSGITVLVK
jgi:SAM-dependent methyltransferase